MSLLPLPNTSAAQASTRRPGPLFEPGAKPCLIMVGKDRGQGDGDCLKNEGRTGR